MNQQYASGPYSVDRGPRKTSRLVTLLPASVVVRISLMPGGTSPVSS